jgi:hypothetical protein
LVIGEESWNFLRFVLSPAAGTYCSAVEMVSPSGGKMKMKEIESFLQQFGCKFRESSRGLIYQTLE